MKENRDKMTKHEQINQIRNKDTEDRRKRVSDFGLPTFSSVSTRYLPIVRRTLAFAKRTLAFVSCTLAFAMCTLAFAACTLTPVDRTYPFVNGTLTPA